MVDYVFLDYDETDFNIPEDAEMDIWERFRDDACEEEIPYVQVPQNLMELYPQMDEDNICVVCRVAPRTHALVLCGHRVICIDCLAQLQAQRCPVCNEEYDIVIRIW